MPVASPPAPMKPVALQPSPAGPVRRAGPGRLRGIVTAIAGGGFAISAGVIGLELVAKPGLRPTDLMATIEARTELSGMNQKMGAEPGVVRLTEADYQRALAKAQREGQAQAELSFQRDLASVQADKERVVAAYQTLYQRANMIAQMGVQMEAVAQQFRQRLIEQTNGGRVLVISVYDGLCALGNAEACESARQARAGMIQEAGELTEGDLARKVAKLMSGIDDPAALVAHEDQQRNGTPALGDAQ